MESLLGARSFASRGFTGLTVLHCPEVHKKKKKKKKKESSVELFKSLPANILPIDFLLVSFQNSEIASVDYVQVHRYLFSFGTLMTATLEWEGTPAFIIGIARGVSATIGIAATLIYPALQSHISTVRTGLWSIWSQVKHELRLSHFRPHQKNQFCFGRY